MKTTILTTAALIGALVLPGVVFAGPFGLPDHEQKGSLDTRCDATAATPIAGSNAVSNPTCPNAQGGGDGALEWGIEE